MTSKNLFLAEKMNGEFLKIESVDVYQGLTRQTAIYPGAMSSIDIYGDKGKGDVIGKAVPVQALAYIALGLGEAGEVQGKIKKLIRDGEVDNEGRVFVPDYKQIEILKEIGDLEWYMARLADELGALRSAVLAKNINKLMSRKDRGKLQGSGDNR